MISEFSCNGDDMKKVLQDLKDIEEILSNTYTTARKVKNDIDTNGCWTGASQMTMLAFLKLLLQYHRDFIKGREKEEPPIPTAVECLEKLQTNLEGFYENWEDYQYLEDIK